MSSSDNPVAFVMSAMLKPIDFKLLAISIALDCSPSARPISIPSLLAVSKLFLMSRYALRLSSYSRSSVGEKRAIAAASNSFVNIFLLLFLSEILIYRSSDCLITDCIIAYGKDTALNQNNQTFARNYTRIRQMFTSRTNHPLSRNVSPCSGLPLQMCWHRFAEQER